MSVFSDLLNGVLRIDRTAPAIEFEGRWHDWGALADTIDAVREALTTAGLGADARIGVMVRNRPSPLAAALAVMSGGMCMVPLNPLLPDDRLAAEIGALRLPAILGESADLARAGIQDALASAGAAVIELPGRLGGAVARPGFERPTGRDLRRDEPGVIIEMLSSGTTGAPKRIPLKREAFDESFVSAMSYEKGRDPSEAPRLRAEVMIVNNPISHIGGLWGVTTCLAAGRRLCLIEKFSVESWRDSIRRHRPKVAGAVPAGLRMILDANIPREDLSSLVALRSGAAALDPAVADEFWERYGIPVLQTYGATEFSGAVAGWTLADYRALRERKRGSVGRFQPGIEGRVTDPETRAVKAPGEEGILEMRSRQFGNGGAWLATTDRAMIDADGFLFILGRADNAIVRGGFKVHADDVVAALEAHEAVREAVVVGVPDRRLGAVPVAAVIARAGATPPDEAELTAFLKARLLPYQVPTRFLFVDDVPRTGSLKPALPAVRAMFAPASAE